MGDSNLEKDKTSSNAKEHDKILQLLEEIKEFEKKFQKYEIIEKKVEEELIEVQPELFEEVEPIPIEKEKKPKIKKLKKAKPEVEVKKKKVEKKPVEPVTFRVRFNEAGKLENIDFKKRKPKHKSGKRSGLKKLGLKRKGKEGTEGTEEKSKGSKLKGGLSRLKKVIPTKSKKTEETKEPTKEE